MAFAQKYYLRVFNVYFQTSEKSSKELKAIQCKNEERKNQELVHSSDENKIDSKVEKEHKRKTCTSSHLEGTQQDGDIQDSKSQFDRTDDSSEEPPKQKNVFKNEKHVKKDDLETQSVRNVPKKEVRSSKERNEKEKNLSEEKLFTKHKSKGDIHKTGEEVESSLSEKSLKNEESFLKHGQLSRALVDEKAEKKNKHRTERKISVSSKDVKNVSDHGSKNEENSHKESNKKDRQISTDKLRIEHKSKKLSIDFRPQKESHGVSKQHSSITSRRSESYTEDKHEVGLSDGTQKDRHRSKSVLEERSLLKSRSKSHSRQVKIPESELQESSSKQGYGQKLDKGKNTEENDPDKQNKLKNETKVLEENYVEFELEHGALSASSSQKDASNRVKSQLAEKSSMKEKLKSDKDLGSFRPERKLSVEGHKNRGPKQSSKDLKKREDNKSEDRSVKQLESNTKIQEKGLLTDKKPVKRLTSENRKGSLSAREVDIGKEKLSPATAVASLSPALQNTRWISEHSLHSELSQEPVEIMSEKKHGDAYPQVEGSSNNSQEESKFTSISKDQIHHNSECTLNQNLNTKELQRHSLSSPNPKQNTEFSATKDFSSPFYAFKRDSKDGGAIEEEQYRIITECETSDKTLLDGCSKGNAKLEFKAGIEDAQTPENFKNIMNPSEESNDPTKNSREEAAHQKCMDIDLTEVTATGIQEAAVKEKNGNGILESDSLIGQGIEFTDVNADKSVLVRIEERKGDNVDGGSFAVNDKSAIECQSNAKESNTVSAPKELCSELVSPNASEDMSRFSAMVNEVERKYDDVRSQSENSVVASSIGGSSCIDICNSIEHDVVVIGTSTERNMGRTMTATSTALDEEVMSKQQKEKDAVITCSEEKGKTALSCTNREADEGYIVGTWTKNKESVHFVTEGHFGECTVTAAEESGAVSEGLAVCESSSASTKEDESAECVVNYVEESTKQLVNKSGIENDQNVNSLIMEEKDDAVTSASSEERSMASACGGTSNFDSATINIGEMESDGAVTSAGAEVQDSSVIIENPDGFQSNATRTEQAKGAEVVTCTGTERSNGGSAICSVTGTDLQEVSVVNRVYAEMDNNEEVGSHVDKNEDVLSGESTVTSTSITAEDDPEAVAAGTGLEDNDEGFVAALNMEEKYEHATDSTEARAEKNMIQTSQGSYDDEGCVTSTGAKEDDEEGENFVTSTGRCTEEAEHILTCTETEESGRVMVSLEASENRHSSISRVADQLGTELNEPTSNADKSSIDSMMSSEKKAKIGDISNSTKGIVESSTTSIGMDNENTAFVTEKEEDSSLIKKCEYDMISATSNNQSLYDFSAQEQKKERVTSCLDSRECESMLRMVSKKISMSPAPANEADKDERETISTSTIKLCPTLGHFSAEHIEQSSSPVAKLVENVSKTSENQRLLSAEDFGTPMPSTGVGIQDEMATKLNKGSAEILEEFEAPMPSITGEDDVNLSTPVRAVEMNTNVGRYTVPLPSISSGGTADGSIIDHSKEERDDCTVISTSIVEETEVSILQEGIKDTAHLSLSKSEEPTDAAMISTSLAEYSETSVFPAKMQEIDQICKIKEKPETSAISTTEECERAVHDVVIPVETRERNEDSMVFRDGIEECKVIRESTGGKFELAVQSAEENNQSTIALVKEGGHSNPLEVSATNNKSDHHLITPSIQIREESTNLSGRILDECDSVNTAVASEESAHTFLEETSLAFLNVEVQDNKKTTDCAKQSDHIMLSPLVSNGKSSAVFHREGQKFHQGDPEGALEESNTSETTGTESIEMLPKTLKSIDTGTNFCTESCFNSSISSDSSTELILQKSGTQNSGQCVEDPSNSSVTTFEKTSTIENLSTDCINHKPALKTERRDSPNRKNFISLGKNSENRTHASEADLCSAHYEPEAFSRSATAYSTGKIA